MVELTGTVESILYNNEVDGFTIANFVITDNSGEDVLVTITGKFFDIKPGLFLHLKGNWVEHMIYGEQFQVEAYSVELPHGEHGLRNYLGSGVLPGIGEKMANQIINQFGENFFDILENNPKKLLKIKGLGKKILDKILKAYNEQKETRDMMISLHEYDISPALGKRIHAKFGKDTARILMDNPYQVALEVRGIGFLKADEIAQKIGYDAKNPKRIKAGLIYALNDCYKSGNTFMSEETLINRASRLLKIENETIRHELDSLLDEGKRVYQDFLGERPIYYPKSLYNAESDAALAIVRLSKESPKELKKLEKRISKVEKNLKFELDEEQRYALEAVSKNPITIITGGPGTGKSATSLIVKY